ncbi:MAG: Ppx/GppA family phosphatase [Actinomycetota bacterium]|nr:Ppx/GppA family phosphatase [Actinomycetota bacterium]
MDRATMIVGVVDIGTNSMRLLVVDDGAERARDAVVTALGSGVDRTGRFNPDRVATTLDVLGRFGETMDRLGVERRRAVATSATRNAGDGAAFIMQAARVLGVVPEVISGTEEAGLSYLGATASFDDRIPTVVIDIGGGSTEFVYGKGTMMSATSIELGSVRLTERLLPSRPTPEADLRNSRSAAAEAFNDVPASNEPARAIGVAGSFTSLAAITLDLSKYDRARVHGAILTAVEIDHMIERLSTMTIAETRTIPSLDPNRAPVILAGAILAEAALAAVGFDQIYVSERDLLDGLALDVVRSS